MVGLSPRAAQIRNGTQHLGSSSTLVTKSRWITAGTTLEMPVEMPYPPTHSPYLPTSACVASACQGPLSIQSNARLTSATLHQTRGPSDVTCALRSTSSSSSWNGSPRKPGTSKVNGPLSTYSKRRIQEIYVSNVKIYCALRAFYL